jgi:nitrous oxidase accessory protein
LFSQRIVVGKQGNYSSIKSAIAKAKAGDTILIKAGIYKEGNITIDKPLVLIGEGYPVLDGENKYEILTIHSHDVTISGLKFIETGAAGMQDIAAIKVLDSKRIRITGNKFVNSFFGIHLSNSSQSWIKNNRLDSEATAEHEIGNGIHLWKCDHITIDGNTIKGHRDGIYFEFVTNSLITNNWSEANIRYGLHFMFSHDDEYRNNTFFNNGAGVSVMYTKGVKMINNTFIKNWGAASYGMLLKDIRDSFVSGNKFIDNSTGIYMEGSSRIHFEENLFSGNGYAVKLQASCDDNVFTKNNFSANTFDIATNGSLVLNKVNSNYWDRYEGYDLNKDKVGDVPYHPVSMYSMIVERMPAAVLLWRSFLVLLMDKAEKAIPAITPENLKDDSPSMKPYRVLRSSNNSKSFSHVQ